MTDPPRPDPRRARPIRDGVVASTLHLPPGDWPSVLDGLCAHFPAIGRERWQARMRRGLVLDAAGEPIDAAQAYRPGLRVHYFREVEAEPVVAAAETIVHADADLVVVDKPPGLPVVPAGGHVRETLLARLIRRFGNPDLVPLHRIDRATSGLVLFSADPASRARYQALFPARAVRKHYQALAPALPDLAFPLLRRSRIVAGTPFPRMREAPGEANAQTRIDVAARGASHWRYALEPLTGRKHQLRVQMAALGAPIAGDDLYGEGTAGEPARLRLLACALAFDDPLDGRPRRFVSTLRLDD
ncbi:MAG TPA: pseudouridine synthase [Dokdonella sp.]|uniref:pseudouridine synthase n=1 Tax=Dokdonella sp. TaxID=2291710 RepID=UPI002D11C20E|nr:pseudouridine synthase [Dokdonella sp.]HUD42947.1 pseudouridine synthase [Dokdonella sp.]